MSQLKEWDQPEELRNRKKSVLDNPLEPWTKPPLKPVCVPHFAPATPCSQISMTMETEWSKEETGDHIKNIRDTTKDLLQLKTPRRNHRETGRRGRLQFSSVQSLSCVRLFANSWIATRQASLSITNSQSSLRLMSIESEMPSRHLILCCPLLLLPPIPPSTRASSNESTHRIRWPKYWSFNLSISPSNEHPGLVSFRMDWLDLLAVQGTLKSLLQHHSLKASILRCSAFFTVQLSHPYMTTGKTIALTRRTFVGKVISLLFNMLSRLVITFLPRSKRLLISWLRSLSAVISEPKK